MATTTKRFDVIKKKTYLLSTDKLYYLDDDGRIDEKENDPHLYLQSKAKNTYRLSFLDNKKHDQKMIQEYKSPMTLNENYILSRSHAPVFGGASPVLEQNLIPTATATTFLPKLSSLIKCCSLKISFDTLPVNFLGSGRYSQVYKGHFSIICQNGRVSENEESTLTFLCGIKLLLQTDPESLIMAKQEAQLLINLLDCPYIIDFYGLFIEASLASSSPESSNLYQSEISFSDSELLLNLQHGQRHKSKESSIHFMMLEYCSNGSIYSFLNTKPERITKKLIYLWGFQLASALSHLKSKGIIHHDIKPHNIFLTDSLDTRLGDFNNARYYLPAFVTSLDDDGLGLGTQAYMAPEILTLLPYDYSVDVYSFGVTFYYILTGNDPFGRIINHSIQLLLGIKKGFFKCGFNDWFDNKRPFSDLLQDISLVNIIERCVQVNPNSRPSPVDLMNYFKEKLDSFNN